jgi:hypothetical protein
MLHDERSSSSPADGDAGPTRFPVARLIDAAGVPAPEALRATTVAAAVVRELHESGREVRFALVGSRARVAILLCDTEGGVVGRMTPSRALEIATGELIPRSRSG